VRRWLLVLLIVGQAAAQEARITELQLEGCRVTEPQKVLAAIGFQPGMPYDAERLQKALMDLGLFESVTLETTQIPQGVQVTAKVQEKTHPAPKTEEAARALNPIAVVRQWLAYQSPFLPLAEDKTISFYFGVKVPKDFALFTPHGYGETLMSLIAKVLGKAPWVKEALKATDEEAARKTLLVELERHLKRSPNDAWARFVFAYILAAEGRHEEAERQVATLLARRPDFPFSYLGRLHLATLRISSYLGTKLKLPPSHFPLPPPNPTSPGLLRQAIDEGIAYFHRLPDRAWRPETLIAASLFFVSATGGEILLLMAEFSKIQDDETDPIKHFSRLTERLTEYLTDYLWLSQKAERFANDLTVQKAIGDLGEMLVTTCLTFIPLSNFASTAETDEPEPEQWGEFWAMALRTNLRIMRPYLERHQWHLKHLTVKNSPYRADAFNALAKCLALLGDFSAAQKAMETALREMSKLEWQTLNEVMGLHALWEGNKLTPTLVARYVAWLDGLERQHPLPVSVALWLSYWRLWLAAKGDAEAMWEKVPEAERREALNRLRRSVQQFPSDAGSWWSLGIMALALNDVPTASEAFTKATELDPKNVAYRYALGLVALAQGDFQRAIELLKAMETNP